MWSKLFSPLLAYRLKSAQKFPQIKFRPQFHNNSLTHQRKCHISLELFDLNSLDFAQREILPGSIVELRSSEQNRLLALGFYEPGLHRIDVFHISTKMISTLPIINEEFFLDKFQIAWERRKNVFKQFRNNNNNNMNNTYRIINGAADGIPSLYVDIFSSSFARIIATSLGAERLIPAITEYLRTKGAEQILLHSPYLKDREKLTLIHPTISLPSEYIENGIRYLWLPNSEFPSTINNRYIIHSAYRRTRLLLREICKNKRVLCLNDCSGSAALNALMSAKHVIISEKDEILLERIRENLILNHGNNVFNSCETISTCDENLQIRKQDVIYFEHHKENLSSFKQWKDILSNLLRNNICGEGTLLFITQEIAPLGISDLLNNNNNNNKIIPAKREEIIKAFCDAAREYNLSIRLIRTFGPSIDYPILPLEESKCFSQIFVLEGKSN